MVAPSGREREGRRAWTPEQLFVFFIMHYAFIIMP